jgi:signal transduction histidine kinase
VIALGRLMMASLFLLAIWLDVTQPAKSPAASYALLFGYLAFAAGMVAATWRNWWFDAQSAGPAQAIDMAFFAVIVFLTAGYTSPYFVFFMFLLLAPAIRWGWRETTLTAILVVLLYLVSGLLAVSAQRAEFELDVFLIRTADLLILSLILIWFGINKWGARPEPGIERALSQAPPGSAPLESGVRAAMSALRAGKGSALWRPEPGAKISGFTIRDGEIAYAEFPDTAFAERSPTPLLYDLPRARALTRDARGNLVTAAAEDLPAPQVQSKFALSEGLAISVRTPRGEALLLIEGIAALSTDHIEIGGQIADAIAAHIQRHSLIEAAEESAAARSRLSLARDLHDSVVQFLAGAAFRLEAMRRAQGAGREIEAELDELKKLMLQEQVELRSFITALRSGSQVTLRDLVRDLQSLADRLSRQWTVKCALSAKGSEIRIPAKLHLDAHQLVREAVANAVRHAGAKSIEIAVAANANELRLDFINDGRSYPRHRGRLQPPKSLQERIEQAGGAMELSRGMDVTKVSISLPIAAAGAA